MTKFYNSLLEHIRANETNYANGVIMQELGRILAEDRENFVLLLRNSGLPATAQNSDADLVEMFLDNLPHNRSLLAGAALLVNHNNKTVGFDGEEELSDAGVKAVHKVMFNHFVGARAVKDFSSAEGEGGGKGAAWAAAIKSIVDVGGKVGGDVLQRQHQKKRGATDLLYKKQQAKIDMAQAASERRTIQQQALIKEKADKQKTNRRLIIGISITAGILILGGIYLATRKKGAAVKAN